MRRDGQQLTPTKSDRLQTSAEILLAVATLLIAWSAYQSTRWSGIMSINFSRSNAERSQTVLLENSVGQQIVADVVLVSEWIAAVANGEYAAADTFRARMTGEVRKAMDSWLVNWSPGDPLPDGLPFDGGRYDPPLVQQAIERTKSAQSSFAKGQTANQAADNYILTAVLVACALFFASLAPRVNTTRGPWAFIVFSIAALTIGLGLMAIQPVTVRV
jgi:hypothetical protein